MDDLVGSEEARSELLIEGGDSIHDYPMLVNVVADKFVHVEIEERGDGVFSFRKEGFIQLGMDPQNWDVYFKEKQAILSVLAEINPFLKQNYHLLTALLKILTLPFLPINLLHLLSYMLEEVMLIHVVLQKQFILAHDFYDLICVFLVEGWFLYEFGDRVKTFPYFLVAVLVVVRDYLMVKHGVLKIIDGYGFFDKADLVVGLDERWLTLLLWWLFLLLQLPFQSFQLITQLQKWILERIEPFHIPLLDLLQLILHQFSLKARQLNNLILKLYGFLGMWVKLIWKCGIVNLFDERLDVCDKQITIYFDLSHFLPK